MCCYSCWSPHRSSCFINIFSPFPPLSPLVFSQNKLIVRFLVDVNVAEICLVLLVRSYSIKRMCFLNYNTNCCRSKVLQQHFWRYLSSSFSHTDLTPIDMWDTGHKEHLTNPHDLFPIDSVQSHFLDSSWSYMIRAESLNLCSRPACLHICVIQMIIQN